MSIIFKSILAVIISAAIILLIYYGSYLPLIKSKLYIDAMMTFKSGKIRSLEDFNNAFNPVLNFSSPIGQGEITSYYLSNVLNIIRQQSNKELIEILAKQAGDVMAPILKTKKGFGFNQSLYSLGTIYKIAGMQINNATYYQKSIDIFNKGLEYSPNRFIFLAGLFDDYQLEGNKEKVKEIGETILRYWPNNDKVKETLNKIN